MANDEREIIEGILADAVAGGERTIATWCRCALRGQRWPMRFLREEIALRKAA